MHIHDFGCRTLQAIVIKRSVNNFG